MKGGTPEIDRAAIAKQPKVMGILEARPPSRVRSVVPVCRSTAPAVRKRVPLYMALFNMWKRPPTMPIAVPVPMPRIM